MNESAEVPRMQAAIERYGARFLNRIFTPAEIFYCESKANKYERFAARFVAKQSALKAIGTGWKRGITQMVLHGGWCPFWLGIGGGVTPWAQSYRP